jgi:hypothetical protein
VVVRFRADAPVRLRPEEFVVNPEDALILHLDH